MEDLLPPSIPRPSFDLEMSSSGGIYDIATDNYEPPENQQSTIEDINQEGFDELLRQEEGLGGAGLPEGFEEEELDVVEDDNTPGTRIFLTKEA